VDVLVTAANAGHDTDTIASMAGNLVGALVGAERLRAEKPEWWDQLEDRDRLIGLADCLLAVASGQAEG
jgi:ADP-ribosylglycohydrolase